MDSPVELTTFSTTGDAYVYAPLPAATSYGHRAELWNPDKWLQEVKVKVVTAGDLCFVRMTTKDTGELFAECPLPADGTPLTTAVDAVVDSSRYFVVRVVDRESRKHAFIGVGFRDRMDASDFSAALDEYRQYLRRKQEAELMRREFDAVQLDQTTAADGSDSGAAAVPGRGQEAATSTSAVQKDFSLKPGETLHIKLLPNLQRSASGKASAAASILQGGGSSCSSSVVKTQALSASIPLLAPPSSSSGSSSTFFRTPPPSPGASAAPVVGSSAEQHIQQEPLTGSELSQVGQTMKEEQWRRVGPLASTTGSVEPDAAAGASAVDVAATGRQIEEDDWGDFVG